MDKTAPPTYKPRERYPLALPGQYSNDEVKSIVLRPYRGRDVYHATLKEEDKNGVNPIVRLERFSTISGFVEKTALIQWSANWTSRHMYRHIAAGEAYDEQYLLTLLDEARYAWKEWRDQCGDWGTEVHRIIEVFLKSNCEDWPGYWGDTEAPVHNSCHCFAKWWPETGLVPLQVEKYVYNMDWAYGGRVDLLAKDPLGKFGPVDGMGIADWKTSGQISPGFFLQMYAYGGALIELGYPIEWGLVVRLGREETEAQVEVLTRQEIIDGWKHWRLMCSLWPWWKTQKSRASKSNRQFEKTMIAGSEAETKRDFQKWLSSFQKEDAAWLAALEEQFKKEVK